MSPAGYAEFAKNRPFKGKTFSMEVYNARSDSVKLYPGLSVKYVRKLKNGNYKVAYVC